MARTSHNSLLLRTKLYRPTIPADHVVRSELLKGLEKYPDRPLVLVSAPAGYGKSTLVSHWLEGGDKTNAWLSLDEGDDDLHQFFTYFLAALQTLFSDSFRNTMELLQARDLPPVKVLASSLVNEIERINQRFVLVLDDIHRIRKNEIYDFLDLLLCYPSPSMQLVMVACDL